MKIKGKFIIPLVAIMIAMFTLGVTPGFAGNTEAAREATTVYDTLTYTTTTQAPEPPLEEVVGGYISSAFGEDLENAGGSMVETGGLMNKLLLKVRNILNSFVKIFERIGLMMGNSNINLGGGLGGLLG